MFNGVVITEQMIKERNVLKKQEAQYISDLQRPNVHTGLHYQDVLEEYGLPSNINVLIGEDKHRWFKLIVYLTNHSKVEKTMLGKENLQQTIRLLLLNAFQHTDPELTESFAGLRDKCPALFASILPCAEQEQLAINAAVPVEEDEEECGLLSDDAHLRATAINRIQARYARVTLKLPLRSAHMTTKFRQQLRHAYIVEYGLPHIYEFGTSAIRWCKKLSFYDRSVDILSFPSYHLNINFPFHYVILT